ERAVHRAVRLKADDRPLVVCAEPRKVAAVAGGDDLPAGGHGDRADLVVDSAEVERGLSAQPKAQVEAAVRVEARQREIEIAGRTLEAAEQDLAVRLQGERVRSAEAAEVDGRDAVRPERAVERAVRVVAGERELTADVRGAGDQDLPCGRDRDA